MKYYTPNLFNLIARYVAGCQQCAERQPDNRRPIGKLKTGQIHDLYDKWQVDAIGPLKATERENKYILVGIETLSGYVITRAVKEVNAVTLANFLIRDIFLTFSIPKYIQFDNASVNRSKLIAELLNQINCHPIFITPYQHRSSGKVERTNRSVEESLSKIIDKNQDNWDLLLPIVTYNHNCNISKATKHSPHYLVDGRHPNIPLDIALDAQQHVGIPNRVQDLLRIKFNLLDYQNKYAESFNCKRGDENLAIGTRIVLKRNNFTKGLSQKLQTKYMGPYKIVKQLSPLTYRLKILDETAKKKYTNQHIDRIKILGKNILEVDDDLELTTAPTKNRLSITTHPSPQQTDSRQLKRLKTTKSNTPSIPKTPTTKPPQQEYTNRYGRIITQPLRYTK